MKTTVLCGLSVCVCAGGLASAGETPTRLEASVGRVVDVAHIYFNLATGEKIITLEGESQTAPADSGASGAIWSSRVSNQCAEYGFDTEFFFVVSDYDSNSSVTPVVSLLDFGDIATDTVVDCVHINWVTDHDDIDADSDGVGDGVEGLGGIWTWWDRENGRLEFCDRVPIVSFVLADLPGDISGTTDPNDPANTLARYSMDVDLSSSFSSALTFEICDTDGDSQGAAFHNPLIGTFDENFDGMPDSDLDGDGLADWGWSVLFYQPGTHDFDGDGVVDGDPLARFRAIGVAFGAPEGEAIDNGDGTWLWDIDTTLADAGTGVDDAFTLYTEAGEHVGVFWFGGFSCDDDGFGYTPSAMFDHQLFGPACSGCGSCHVDLNGDGALNFFDVSLFLADFSAGGDYNGDGVTNFFDVSAFLSDFSAGCP